MCARRYEVISLDFGETLIHPWPDWGTFYRQVYAEVGIHAPPEQLLMAAYAGWTEDALKLPLTYPPEEEQAWLRRREIERRILARLGYDDEAILDRLVRRLIEITRDPNTYRLYPDVPETLERLRAQGYQLGIVSNWDWYLPDLCQALGLDRYVDFIVASARVGAEKPHPAIFQAALAHARTSPERVLHVGDNPEADVRGARQVGLAAVLIDRHGLHNDMDVPIIHSLTELPDLLCR
ncbi:MAG TPA: HAD-IIIA family hydrolase [Caldilineae bacterium]|nr:HAD-IIIA family hydrolase [Caldilineae bacterium]